MGGVVGGFEFEVVVMIGFIFFVVIGGWTE